jgi:hypothetical protein
VTISYFDEQGQFILKVKRNTLPEIGEKIQLKKPIFGRESWWVKDILKGKPGGFFDVELTDNDFRSL